MRGDFEAYLNDSFRDENGKLDLDKLLVLEDEADMDVAVIMPNTQTWNRTIKSLVRR